MFGLLVYLIDDEDMMYLGFLEEKYTSQEAELLSADDGGEIPKCLLSRPQTLSTRNNIHQGIPNGKVQKTVESQINLSKSSNSSSPSFSSCVSGE